MRAESTTDVQTLPASSSNGDSMRQDDAAPRHVPEEVVFDLPPMSGWAVAVLGVVVLLLFAGLFVLGFVPHTRQMEQARADAAEAAGSKPLVNVVLPRPRSKDPELLLPGDVRAMQATALYPRTNGYVTELLVDIGDKVQGPRPARDGEPATPGQPLARISAPEVDAELEQAKASLEQAKVVVGRANNEFTFNQATYERYQGLAKTGGVTQQQLDERRSAFNIANSNLKAANASVLAAEASVKRFTELQSFQTIYAPFDGVVTARNFDVGTRVSTNDSGGRELFQVQQTNTLRVFVNVPQGYVASIGKDQEGELTVRSQDGPPLRVTGKVIRTAEALDPQTRTLRVEVHVPNEKGQLLPGMYGEVRFKIQSDRQPLVIPTSALMYGSQGLRVAVVDVSNKVQLRAVTLGRDYGTEAEVGEGVAAGERIVANPGDRLVDGVEVEIAPTKQPPAPAKPAAVERPATKPAAS